MDSTIEALGKIETELKKVEEKSPQITRENFALKAIKILIKALGSDGEIHEFFNILFRLFDSVKGTSYKEHVMEIFKKLIERFYSYKARQSNPIYDTVESELNRRPNNGTCDVIQYGRDFCCHLMDSLKANHALREDCEKATDQILDVVRCLQKKTQTLQNALSVVLVMLLYRVEEEPNEFAANEDYIPIETYPSLTNLIYVVKTDENLFCYNSITSNNALIATNNDYPYDPDTDDE